MVKCQNRDCGRAFHDGGGQHSSITFSVVNPQYENISFAFRYFCDPICFAKEALFRMTGKVYTITEE